MFLFPLFNIPFPLGIVYECLKTIATIYVNQSLVEKATSKASVFLISDDYNLKYLGKCITIIQNFSICFEGLSRGEKLNLCEIRPKKLNQFTR